MTSPAADQTKPDQAARRRSAILARITEVEEDSLRAADPFDVQLGIMQSQLYRDIYAQQGSIEQRLDGGGTPLERLQQAEALLKNYLAAARRITRNANAALHRN